jgi:hypothetical protein
VQWTDDDEAAFMAAYQQYGKAWKVLEAILPGKTREQIQSRTCCVCGPLSRSDRASQTEVI